MQTLRVAVVFAAVAAAGAPPIAEQDVASRAIWPTRGWPTTTPESQGMDSAVLAEMLELVQARQLPLHQMLVVRHGRVVLNASVYPYEPTHPHDIASASKSVTSMLIGLAIDKGLIRSVREPVAALLPRAMPAAPDRRLEQLTVEDLLTMRSGLDCGVEPGERELARMRRSNDWPAFALALPMRFQPGTQYAYCSCNNHLLSAIISAKTGGNALAFARQHLFEPLGIRDAVWPADPQGRTHGWGDLHLYPRDLAKLAYLYLHRGRWEDRQLLSEAWVRESIAPRVTVRDGVGYGYGWWINTARTPAVFEMVGRGGQRAAVLPDKDLVVVFNGGGVDTDVLAGFLFRAIRSDDALPDNPASAARLRQRLAQVRLPPAPRSPAALPALAAAVSGTRYDVETNPANLQHFSLTFSGQREAQATLRLLGGEWTVPVGLDGRYRFSASGPAALPMAARGHWISSDEFVLDLNTVANINHFSMRMRFVGRDVQLRLDEATGEIRNLSVSGRARPRTP